jgi:predicted MPP superfamily phosphohydrolase
MNVYETSFSGQISLRLLRKLQIASSKVHEKLGRNIFRPEDFDIVRVSIPVSGLDPAFNGYRSVQISDIHMGQWITAERLKGIVALVNEEKPDLVAFTGDSVSYEVDEIAEDLASNLAQLRSTDGSVGVLGNHDHWMGADKVREALVQGKIIDLNNAIHTIYREGEMLHLAGVDDIMLKKDRLDEVLKELPSSGPAIMLAHEPDFADISASTGRFALQLSGHSHGGQIAIPLIGTPVRLFMKYPMGMYRVGDMIQYTNRGLGTNEFWFRINCPPEITVFTLKALEGTAFKGKAGKSILGRKPKFGKIA